MTIVLDTVTKSVIHRVLDGDTNAYEELYGQIDHHLRAFIQKLFGHYGRDFVEEVAIVTHEEALARLGEYDPDKGAYLTWLGWISRTVAHRFIRERYGPRYAPFNANWLEEQVAPGPGPAEKIEHDRRCRVLREELSQLPEDLRRVIELYDFEGRTLTESAQELNIPVYKASRRRKRGLRILEKELTKRDVHIVERSWTPPPRFYPGEATGYDDDWCATVGAYLPDDPDPLTDRAAKGEPGENEQE